MTVESVCKDSVWLTRFTGFRQGDNGCCWKLGGRLGNGKYELVGKQREISLINGTLHNRDRCCFIKTRKRISRKRIAQFYVPESGKQQDSTDQDFVPHVWPFILQRKRFPLFVRMFGFTL